MTAFFLTGIVTASWSALRDVVPLVDALHLAVRRVQHVAVRTFERRPRVRKDRREDHHLGKHGAPVRRTTHPGRHYQIGSALSKWWASRITDVKIEIVQFAVVVVITRSCKAIH